MLLPSLAHSYAAVNNLRRELTTNLLQSGGPEETLDIVDGDAQGDQRKEWVREWNLGRQKISPPVGEVPHQAMAGFQRHRHNEHGHHPAGA